MAQSFILWRLFEQSGHDAARLCPLESGWRLSGVSVFAQEQRPCKLDYVVECDSDWRTRLVRVSGWMGDEPIELDITADAGVWKLNGVEHPEVAGCVDVDLSFTPATNLLPIRRLNLAIGSEAPVVAAWLRVPGFKLEQLDQVYRRTAENCYHYESNSGTFVRDLEVTSSGFVLHYPGLWQAEATAEV